MRSRGQTEININRQIISFGQGDYITGINDEVITNKKELIAAVKKLDDENVVLHLRRKDQPVDVRLKAVESSEEEYRLGIWVRDNAQGLGTVTS